MNNLVEKFTPAVEAEKSDEGLVTVEWIALLAGVAVVAAAVAKFDWLTTLSAKITSALG
jgi:hypothetical protein